MDPDPLLLAFCALMIISFAITLFLLEASGWRREERYLRQIEKLQNRLVAKDLASYIALEKHDDAMRSPKPGPPIEQKNRLNQRVDPTGGLM